MRDNAQRVKRFRELKATLRTHRERLLVGIDIAQAAHVVHLRHAHTRVVTPTCTVPTHAPSTHTRRSRRSGYSVRSRRTEQMVYRSDAVHPRHQANSSAFGLIEGYYDFAGTNSTESPFSRSVWQKGDLSKNSIMGGLKSAGSPFDLIL